MLKITICLSSSTDGQEGMLEKKINNWLKTKEAPKRVQYTCGHYYHTA